MAVRGGVERAKANLEKEEKDLIHTKEAIQQQLKVLQAEAVTIQRLLHAHSRQLERGGGEQLEEFHMEPPQDGLPELNLDIELDARQRSPVSEEEEEEEEEEEDHG